MQEGSQELCPGYTGAGHTELEKRVQGAVREGHLAELTLQSQLNPVQGFQVLSEGRRDILSRTGRTTLVASPCRVEGAGENPA
jgi:hypothetical protein